MAIPHFDVRIISRGDGRSAVLAAAYRHCTKMEYEREARTVDYRRKPGLLHEEFVIPNDAPTWLRVLVADRSAAGASEAFWNKVKAFEKRSDAQLAKDVTIGLPLESTAAQNIALVRDFVDRHVLSKGMVADWAYHDVPGNPHVHLMMTLRPLTESGFGQKTVQILDHAGKPIRNAAGTIALKKWAGGKTEFNAFRDGWFACQNQHLALAGLDLRVDGRSFEKQGIKLEPTIHIGVRATAMDRAAKRERSSLRLERIEIQDKLCAKNSRRIQRRPEIVVDLISRQKSVFDERDVAKVLNRYVDDAATFQNLFTRILQSPQVLRLERERLDFATGIRLPAKYTTRALIRLEAEMVNRAIWLARRSSHRVREAVREATLARWQRLSDEQRTALAHVTGGGRCAAIVGRAGAGKTTMMKAALEAWQAAGYRVVGGALAGKAAEGLEKEAGIFSRTLSSWELRWCEGRDTLDDRTVFVLDEAGMVSSRQMAFFVEAAARTGAKLVLIGDPGQLQPIEAGAAFRAIVDRVGYAELETIYRQREDWMRAASLDLARGRVAEAVEAYDRHGRLIASNLKAQAIAKLIADWDRDYDPAKTSLILAHLRRDVRMLNEMARARLVERGLVGEGHAFTAEEGVRRFDVGDQIVFLRNEASLGVKNGMIGRVIEAAPNRIVAEVGEGEHRRQFTVESRFYAQVDHGYATTIHKSQGATVDRVKVLASLSLDRHLTYVAMTRHREELAVYYGARAFARAGGLTTILARRNAKETTLDYAEGTFYRQALRFAEARGLHLMNVARTLLRDRLEWTVRQKQRLVELGERFVAGVARLGLSGAAKQTFADVIQEGKPMVAGMTTFPKTLEQAVEERLAADPSLKRQWQEVSSRFQLVFVDPEAAFRTLDVEGMVKDQTAAKTTLSKINDQPEAFGVLRGRTGLFASRADKKAREQALLNAPALARNLANYLRLHAEAERRYEAEERSARVKASIDIPALSNGAKQVLARVRDVIDRNDPSAALEYAGADRKVKAELDRFAKAVADRFGERVLLGIAAKDPAGQAFDAVTAGMTAAQKAEVQSAWTMRTAQQLAARERTTEALKRAETLRQTQQQGLTLR